MKTKKKLREYWNKGVRHLKHRKGFGVHSPFAFSIITEVIEEKSPYYAYSAMRRFYPKKGPLPFKVACLLFRLANRFKCRRLLEVGCERGDKTLPLLLVDKRNEIYSAASQEAVEISSRQLKVAGERGGQLFFIADLAELPTDWKADMIVIDSIPQGMDAEECFKSLFALSTDRTLFFISNIRPGMALESLWDRFCDCDDIEITMDLYDYGIAIRKPRFFKQHYVVSF